MSKAQYLQMANAAAAKHGVPLSILAGVIQTESNWDPTAKAGTSSAKGLGQFVDGTAKQYGVNVDDAASSIDGAARYLKDLHGQFGDWSLAARGYHDGAGNLKKLIAGKGGGNNTAEAREYVGKVLKAGAAYGDVPQDKASQLNGAPSMLAGASIPFAAPGAKGAVKGLGLAPVKVDTGAGAMAAPPAPTQMAAAPQAQPPLNLQPVDPVQPDVQMAAAGPEQGGMVAPAEKPMGLTSLLEGALGSASGKSRMLQPTRPRGYDAILDRLIG
jgi:Transglycosylase SLT domain